MIRGSTNILDFKWCMTFCWTKGKIKRLDAIINSWQYGIDFQKLKCFWRWFERQYGIIIFFAKFHDVSSYMRSDIYKNFIFVFRNFFDISIDILSNI